MRNRGFPPGKYTQHDRGLDVAIPGVRLAPTTVELDEEDVFDEDKARRDAVNSFENVWTNWKDLAATIDCAIQDCLKDNPLWKTVDGENVTKNSRGVLQYLPVDLLQLDVLRVIYSRMAVTVLKEGLRRRGEERRA